jgi:hypothetical protein
MADPEDRQPIASAQPHPVEIDSDGFDFRVSPFCGPSKSRGNLVMPSLAADVVLGWLWGRTGSLLPPILTHAGNAGLKLAALLW